MSSPSAPLVPTGQTGVSFHRCSPHPVQPSGRGPPVGHVGLAPKRKTTGPGRRASTNRKEAEIGGWNWSKHEITSKIIQIKWRNWCSGWCFRLWELKSLDSMTPGEGCHHHRATPKFKGSRDAIPLLCKGDLLNLRQHTHSERYVRSLVRFISTHHGEPASAALQARDSCSARAGAPRGRRRWPKRSGATTLEDVSCLKIHVWKSYTPWTWKWMPWPRVRKTMKSTTHEVVPSTSMLVPGRVHSLTPM